MQKNSRTYTRLLRAQGILKERDAATLAAVQRQIAQLREENEALAAMMRQGTYADFIDPQLISKRIKRNHRVQATYEAEQHRQIDMLLQSSRRYERIDKRRKDCARTEERQELAQMLAEYIGRYR